jgi:hypothetical protein
MDSREEAIRNSILRVARVRFGQPSYDDLQKLQALLAEKGDFQLEELLERIIETPSLNDFLNEYD